MTVGIVGLGLIGGSFARVYKEKGYRVLAHDADGGILDIAALSDVVDGVLDAGTVARCELVILSIYPQATVDWLREMAPHIPADTLVMDSCGVKRGVCEACFAIAAQHGFTFVGGHPMAGTQFAGFKNSRASMFKGASLIVVPPRFDDIDLFDRVETLLAPAGFGRLTISTAERHDSMIAFASQLAHVVSSAYIKSPAAREHKGYSASSYKDMTRVAWLNENMWTELFLANRDNLIRELDVLISSMRAYREALAEADAPRLRQLLAEGRQLKEELDLPAPR